jgi:hypothetical protein
MLTGDSTGKDWKSAKPENRRTYVEAGCRRSVEMGLSSISPSLVEKGISDYYHLHEQFHHKLDDAFGEVSSAVIKNGQYRCYK